VHIIEIDHLHTELLEGVFNGGPDEGQPIVQAPVVWPLGITRIAEFGGDQHLVAMRADKRRQKSFIGTETVHVGRIEQADTAFECPVERRSSFILVDYAVKFAHPNAAKALRPYEGAVGAEANLGNGGGKARHRRRALNFDKPRL
jgi:hypothetical protein